MKSIIFVDDEPNVLQGLKRMLRKRRDEWDMTFASSGEEALGIMEGKHFDVVVSDMRMPGMDGAELLARVKDRYPESVRIVLSGQSEKGSILRSIGPSHQYLSKPCDPEQLKLVIDRTLELQSFVQGENVRELAAGLDKIPSMPELFRKVVDELESPTCSLDRVGQIIASDIGMSAQILKLVNSAYFGLPNPMESIERAVTYLGVETITSLILINSIFTELEGGDIPGFSFHKLWEHSLMTAICARAIAKEEQFDRSVASEMFMASMLHDIGKLILVANLPDEYTKVLAKMEREGKGANAAEKEVFGCTHDELGAYLLGLWGISGTILEAIAFHSRPVPVQSEVLPACTVHVATLIASEIVGDVTTIAGEMEALGLSVRLERWQEVCSEALAEATT